MTTRPKIGFVGIGNMGAPMAANVARAGFPLTIYDADAERARAFAQEHGCGWTADLAELGAASEILVTMLPTGPIVRSVLIETEGGRLARSMPENAIVVDMSSSEPVGTVELGAALKEHGVRLVDAPVSGGVPKATDGTLAIMYGAEEETAVERVKPLLSAMGQKLFRTGGLGTGHAMKALNNYIAAAGFTAAAEALIVGERFGLDPATMIEIVNNSTGRNFNTELPIKDHVLTRSFASGFQLGLMAKDVKIAGDLAENIGVDAPLSRLVREMWGDARDALGAEQDFSAAIKRWEEKNREGGKTDEASGTAEQAAAAS